MTAKDVIPIRLQLPGIKVTKLIRDDTEALEVAVEAIEGTIRCRACGKKTRQVHQVKATKVRDLPVLCSPTRCVTMAVTMAGRPTLRHAPPTLWHHVGDQSHGLPATHFRDERRSSVTTIPI